MTSLLDQYISGRDWTTTLGGEPKRPSRQYDLEDPATGRFLASAPEVTPDEVDAAVQEAWAAVETEGRCAVIDAWLQPA